MKEELKTMEDLKIEEELCKKLDTEVYLPVKQELEGIDRTYSLGARKEDFKGLIEKKLKELKAEAIKRAKYYIASLCSCKFSSISHGSPFFEATNAKKGISDDDHHTMGKIVEIVEFNNITKEDLRVEDSGGEHGK